MELFGRQGYHATTVAQIEAAAGLAAGAGGLYRHFATKRDVLAEGLRHQFEAGRPLLAYLEADPTDPHAEPARLSRRERFLAVARAGLRRLDQERDVNRLLLRDLASFPDLLEQVRRREVARVHEALTGWLRRELPDHPDRSALAAVLLAAVSHHWVLTDVFGEDPMGVDAERFLTALADLAAGPEPSGPEPADSEPSGPGSAGPVPSGPEPADSEPSGPGSAGPVPSGLAGP